MSHFNPEAKRRQNKGLADKRAVRKIFYTEEGAEPAPIIENMQRTFTEDMRVIMEERAKEKANWIREMKVILSELDKLKDQLRKKEDTVDHLHEELKNEKASKKKLKQEVEEELKELSTKMENVTQKKIVKAENTRAELKK